MEDTTSQQRAAKVTYHLTLRALAGLEGLTTEEVAKLLGLTYQGARKLMLKLEQMGDLPIYLDDESRWCILPYGLIQAYRPVRPIGE